MGTGAIAIRSFRLMWVADRNATSVSGEGLRSPSLVVLLIVISVASLPISLYAQTGRIPTNDLAGDSEWSLRAANLSQRIAQGSSEAKRSALAEIRNLRSERASRLAIPAVSDRDEMVRATAAGSVIFLPPEEATRVLLPLLNDRAEFVRREAAFALGEAGHPSATMPLLRLLEREREIETRSAAVIALGKIGDITPIPQLARILNSRPREEDEFLRRASARAIGRIAQILRTGKTRVVTPQSFLPKRFEHIEPAKKNQIDLSVFRPAIAVLAKVLNDTSEAADTRREAAFALGAIGDSTSVATLSRYLTSDDPYLAEIAKEAVLKIRGEKWPAQR